MANQQHLDILTKQGVNAWNQRRKEKPSITPDLSGANLRDADLSGADFRKTANFRGVVYTRAKIIGTYWPSQGVLTVALFHDARPRCGVHK